MKQKLLSLIQSNNDIDVLTTVKEYIQSTISVLELKYIYYENKEVSGLQYMAHLILIILNNITFSEKKIKKTTNKQWTKPIMDEQIKTRSIMINTNIKICCVC